jgi:hypothetical protein
MAQDGWRREGQVQDRRSYPAKTRPTVKNEGNASPKDRYDLIGCDWRWLAVAVGAGRR